MRGYHFKIMYLENNMCYYASLRKIICEVFFKLSLFFFFSSICCLWRQKCIIPATKLRLRQSRKIYGIPLRAAIFIYHSTNFPMHCCIFLLAVLLFFYLPLYMYPLEIYYSSKSEALQYFQFYENGL